MTEHLKPVREAYERGDYRLCWDELTKLQEIVTPQPEIHRWIARLAYREGRWKTVQESAAAYLQHFPDDRETVQLGARACTNLKQWSKAADAWEHLTGLRPNWPEGWYQLARAHAKSGQTFRADAAAKRLTAAGQGEPLGMLMACRFYIEIDRITHAKNIYVDLAKKDKAGVERELAAYAKRGSLRGMAAIICALTECEFADELQEKSKEISEALIRSGMSSERSGKFDDAYVDYAAAVLLVPAHPIAHRSTSRVLKKLHIAALEHLRNEEFEEALRSYQNIVRCTPEDVKAASQQARLLSQLRRWEQAAEAWRAVGDLERHDVHVRVQFARAVERSRYLEKAGDAWRAVQELEPENGEAERALARFPARLIKEAKVAISEQRLLDAFGLLSRIPADSAERQDADRRLEALGRQLRKEMRAAYKDLKYLKVVQSSSAAMLLLRNDAEVHKLIGKAAMRSLNFIVAEKAWCRLIELQPQTDISHYLELAKCYFHLRMIVEGQRVLSAILVREPDNRQAVALQRSRLKVVHTNQSPPNWSS